MLSLGDLQQTVRAYTGKQLGAGGGPIRLQVQLMIRGAGETSHGCLGKAIVEACGSPK